MGKYVKFDTTVCCMVDDDEEADVIRMWLSSIQAGVVAILSGKQPAVFMNGPITAVVEKDLGGSSTGGDKSG